MHTNNFCFWYKNFKTSPNFHRKGYISKRFLCKKCPGLIPDYKDQPIRYFADHDGVKIFLTDQGPIYKFTQKKETKTLQPKISNIYEGKTKTQDTIISNYLTVKWRGANPHPIIETANKCKGYYTYLSGHTDKELHSIITDGYGKIVYHDLYPGIDVEYKFPEKGGLEYNFIVHPGANMSKIKMQYEGAKNIRLDQGNITIQTNTGTLIEHAPVSYIADGTFVASIYDIVDSTITVSLPNGYDQNQTLIIDPWVSVLSTLNLRNLGSAVDYDAAGNLYVYGAGSITSNDLTDYQKVAKYDVNGNFLWVFNGSVPAANWNTVGGTPVNYLSNIKVDKATNKIYVGQALNNSGVQAIRLTNAGIYDNFITVANANFTEIWSFVDICLTGSIIILGGSNNSNGSIGFIDTVSGVVTSSSITLLPTTDQDIVTGSIDASGNLYVIMASYTTTAANNTIYRSNSSYNGYIWNSPSGFNSFTQIENVPAFDIYESSNNFNGLAANASYLYYYDGYNLAAFDLATGNVIGTPTSILGYVPLSQGGIVADYCNHIYLGGKGAIKTFTFDGNNFTPQADIPLGTGFSTDTVNDLKYDPVNNLLYVAGSQMIGTYVAPYSDTCTLANIFTSTVTLLCNKAYVDVTPVSGIQNISISYLWKDSLGIPIRQTMPDTLLSDTLTGINIGHYTVQIQLNLNCGGTTVTDSFEMSYSNVIAITPSDTIICAGQSTILNCISASNRGSYLWTPGGDTTSSIIVDPFTTTTYSVGYHTPTCGISIDSVVVTVAPLPTVTWTQKNTSAPCHRSTALINATPVGGTFSGPFVMGDSIVNPPGDTTFTVSYTYIDSAGCSGSASLQFSSPQCPNGITALNESNIRLYPNPNTGTFILEAPQSIGSTFTIYDMLGQVIERNVITRETTSISLPGAAAGIYTLEVHSAPFSHAIRFTLLR